MSLLPLVNEALLAERPQAMPQVVLALEQKRNLEAAQLLHQYTLLPLPDAREFIEHHLRGGALSKNRASRPLLTAVHKAMERGDTNYARQLLTAERNKLVLGVKYVKPNSALKEMVNDLLIEGLIWVVVCGVALVGLVMWFNSLKW
jgi:hypothetical protein